MYFGLAIGSQNNQPVETRIRKTAENQLSFLALPISIKIVLPLHGEFAIHIDKNGNHKHNFKVCNKTRLNHRRFEFAMRRELHAVMGQIKDGGYLAEFQRSVPSVPHLSNITFISSRSDHSYAAATSIRYERDWTTKY